MNGGDKSHTRVDGQKQVVEDEQWAERLIIRQRVLSADIRQQRRGNETIRCSVVQANGWMNKAREG